MLLTVLTKDASLGKILFKLLVLLKEGIIGLQKLSYFIFLSFLDLFHGGFEHNGPKV